MLIIIVNRKIFFKMEQKEELRRKAEHTEKMLDRASKLVSGLAGEKDRWEKTVADLESQIGLLPGDCLVAAAFLSYMGPFLSDYREALVTKWTDAIKKEQIPSNPLFSFIEFLANPTQVLILFLELIYPFFHCFRFEIGTYKGYLVMDFQWKMVS